MCRHATQPLPAEPHSALAARVFLAECFQAWDLMPLFDDAALALTELVTNAVLHAGTPLVVSVSCAESAVELAVFDGNPVLPSVRPHRHDLGRDLAQVLTAEAALAGAVDDRDPRLHVGPAGSVAGGRGLLLVDALAAEWGISPLSDGKAVWVRSPIPRALAYADDCRCADSDDSVLLASGHLAEHRVA